MTESMEITLAEMYRALVHFKSTAGILFAAAFLSNGTPAISATVPGSLTFSNVPLVIPEGASEPAIAIGGDGTVVISGLLWGFYTGGPRATGAVPRGPWADRF